MKIALLDDYAGFALGAADWSRVKIRAEITSFDRHIPVDEAVTALADFDVISTIRERMPMPRRLIEKLPRLRMVTIIGMSLPNFDMKAATDHGVIVTHPDWQSPRFGRIASATPELTWGLMIATVRHFVVEQRRMREGLWQSTVGITLAGRTLGLLGLGRIGRKMAEYAKVFGMEVIAWSQNLTAEDAAAVGVERVGKDELFERSDILSIHVVLSERTRGLVAARELGLMKREAYLINTSRGPIVDERALIEALHAGRLAGAGLDVFDLEPPPPDHPFRTMANVTLTPHLGYVTAETMAAFYADTADAIAAFLEGAPVRVINPDALTHPKHTR
jgi:phosphoglycerate dehydrogenase-like enzyme